MCHMLADNLLELHLMAKQIGLKRSWFQTSRSGVPHYDVSKSRRAMAIANGAIEIDRARAAELIRKWRSIRPNG